MHVSHIPGGQIVSGEDDEDDAPVPTAVSQKPVVSALQQSLEPIAPSVVGTASLPQQVGSSSASGNAGEGANAANKPNDAANLIGAASTLGALTLGPAQRASVKAAPQTESYA